MTPNASHDHALQAHLASGGVHLGERVVSATGQLQTPLSESSAIGLGVGHTIAGRRAIVDLVELAGLTRAMDVLSDAASLRARSGGAWSAAVIVRVPVSAGATLPELPPGTRTYVVGRSEDLGPALQSALGAVDPVVIFTADNARSADSERSGEGAWAPAPVVLHDGAHVTLLADGAGVAVALEAAAALAAQGTAAGVIDLRGADPASSAEEVRRTGRIIYVGHRGEGALAGLTRAAFWTLESPPVVLLPIVGAAAVVRAAQESLEA